MLSLVSSFFPLQDPFTAFGSLQFIESSPSLRAISGDVALIVALVADDPKSSLSTALGRCTFAILTLALATIFSFRCSFHRRLGALSLAMPSFTTQEARSFAISFALRLSFARRRSFAFPLRELSKALPHVVHGLRQHLAKRLLACAGGLFKSHCIQFSSTRLAGQVSDVYYHIVDEIPHRLVALHGLVPGNLVDDHVRGYHVHEPCP